MSSSRSSFDSLDTGVTGEVGQVQEEVWLLPPASWVGGASTANGSTPQEVVFELLTGEDKEWRNKVTLRIACEGNCDQAGVPLSAEVTDLTCFCPIWATTRSGTWTVVTPVNSCVSIVVYIYIVMCI